MAAVTIPGSTLSWTTLSEWAALCHDRGEIIRASAAHDAQMTALHLSLTTAHIRASQDVAGLAAARRLLDAARSCGTGLFRGPERSLTRAEIGILLVELHNRQAVLASGRWLLPRTKGPAFEPSLLPDTALERLIQTHRDLVVVERLRAERRSRQLAD